MVNSAFYLNLSADVYVSLNGKIIPNHGYVDINDIGSNDNNSLHCNTNRDPGSRTDSGGDWFAPDGTEVGNTNNKNVPGFVRNRSPMVVRLLRDTGPDPAAQGIFRCTVRDDTNTEENIYVGLYNDGGDYFRSQNVLSRDDSKLQEILQYLKN